MKERFGVGLLVLALACASGAGSGSGGNGPRRNSSVITLEEIEAVEATNAYDLIQRLRPQFLRPAGGGDPVVLYIDGTRREGLGDLRTLLASAVREVRYLDSTEATTLFGTNHRSGAIQLTTRR
jgi:hypothetical protein